MDSYRVDRTGDITRRTWLGLAAAGIGLGPSLFAARATQDEKKAARKGRIIAQVTQFAGHEEITGFIGIDAEDGTWQLLLAAKRATFGRLAPDGKTLAYYDVTERSRNLWAADLGGKEPPRKISDLVGGPISWSPDGKELVQTGGKPGPNGSADLDSYETWRMDADGSHATKLPLARGRNVVDWSADGQWLLTMAVERAPEVKLEIALVHPDGTGHRVIYNGPNQPFGMRISPDSREVAFALSDLRIQNGRAIHRGSSLWVVRIDGEGRRQVPVGDNLANQPCWSPGGKQLAMKRIAYKKDENGDFTIIPDDLNPQILIVDADGKGRRTLSLPEGLVGICDWR